MIANGTPCVGNLRNTDAMTHVAERDW
jgi:hypothetical protein